MDAAVLHALGEIPRFGRFEEPIAGSGEALVHVRAAAIKPLDRAIARGTHYARPRALPVVCGMDGAGRLEDGTRVYFMAMHAPFGAMAQRSVASWHVPVPDGVDDVTAAALVNPGIAAWLPLSWRAGLVPGESVLIMGATGNAGRLTVPIARLLGASRVVAAGRRLDVLAALGADAVIDLNQPAADLTRAFAEAAGPQGFDVIVDYLWGPPTEALIGALGGAGLATAAKGAERGIRLVSVGEMAGAKIALPSAVFRSSHLRILGSGTGNFPPLPQMKAIIGQLFAFAASGLLEVTTESVDLADIADAWERAGVSDRRLVVMPASS